MEKMRVLQINKLYYPVTGGVERAVQQIAEGLCDRTDMKVLACQERGRGVVEHINGVEVHRAGSLGVALSMPLSPSFFHQFRTLSRDSDIIHIHIPFPMADIAVSLYNFKGRVALWWHSDIVRQKNLMAFYKPFMKRLLDRADVIMVATENYIRDSECLPTYRDKCVVIPFGVDPELIKKSDRYAVASKRLNMSNYAEKTPVQFLFVGRLVNFKGCGVLLEALSKVQNAELTVVGSGPLDAILRVRAEQPDISGRVRFLGNIEYTDDALAQAFADCDVLVLPSVARNESFGIVQIEAMAFGKPVINTALPGGVPYVSPDGITGLTVPPNDSDSLANAMQRLVDDPVLRESFGQAAYRRAREEFSMDKMLNRVYTEYERLMNVSPSISL